ncbi:anaerobic benzoate catabolism transcriptional regulator [Planctomycetes bacterium Pla163]|uniref:Anaerobic benzoate catabolism transcriptional regulator n=2 Tax=Rohdeia mirabilis TaxID=2528008 RepID=A0A518D4U9_9BACT|nr:anaerobic benzoate catabolism transcriptional regulator [Planctomycetes bacterium Pla163]
MEPHLPTDDAALARLGERLARQRRRLDLTQAELAHEAGVSKRTVERLESGGSTQLLNFVRVLRALGLLGRLDGLVPDPEPSPLERLRAADAERRRVGRRRANADDGDGADAWHWGDEAGGAGDGTGASEGGTEEPAS